MADPDPNLVHTIGEYLREFTLRLGPNTVESIARGMRDLHLSGGERQQLAEYMAGRIDELAERRRVAAAGPGHHVQVTVDEARNNGRASITRGMVPIWAAAGLLQAGDPVEVMRDEYELTEAETAVVVALTEDFADLQARDEPPPDQDVCRPVTVTVDGQEEVVRVSGAKPMDDKDREMLAELVAATKAYVAKHDPHLEIRQELAAAWMSVSRLLPEGPEKARLRQAVGAARELLSPRKDRGAREETT